MKEKILNNLPLKIISIIIAIIIWYVVTSVSDPIVTRTFSDIPVQITNASYIAEGRKTYQVSEQYQSIAVSIKGNRSVVKGVTADDITVTADLTQIVTMDTDPVYVPVTAVCSGISSNSNVTIHTQTATIPIEIEDVDSAQFPISVDVGDTQPAKEYEIGEQTADPDTITISGPESLIQKISSVVAKVDVSGMSQSGTVKGTLVVIDKNLDEMSETQMNFLTFETGSREVDVNIVLWRKQTGIQLEAEYTGTPEHGYQVTDITTTPEEITVAGSDEALSALAANGNKLTIPAELINIDGQSSDTDITVDIGDVLSDDSDMMITSSAETVTVHVSILPNGSQEYQLDVDQIQRKNLGSNLTVQYDQTQIPVRIKASDEDLETFDISQVTASIDFSGLSAGDYQVPVRIDLPDDYELVSGGDDENGEVTVTVHLREKTDTSASTSTNAN